MNKNIKAINVLNKLIGARISEIICGGSNGTIIVIRTESSLTLTINCVWRLSRESNVLCSWNECNNSTKSNFVQELMQLEDDTISDISKSSLYDIRIEFISGKVLNVFADINSHYGDTYFKYNWELCDINANYCLLIARNLSEDFEVYDPTLI